MHGTMSLKFIIIIIIIIIIILHQLDLGRPVLARPIVCSKLFQVVFVHLVNTSVVFGASC